VFATDSQDLLNQLIGRQGTQMARELGVPCGYILKDGLGRKFLVAMIFCGNEMRRNWERIGRRKSHLDQFRRGGEGRWLPLQQAQVGRRQNHSTAPFPALQWSRESLNAD
jgi:hypothetical protein